MNDKEQPLIPNIQEPVSYAVMHENGNFALYGSESQIDWQSFDYPTHTILGGQKLRSGVDLISGKSRLSVQDTNGSVEIHVQSSESVRVSVISDALKGSLRRPIFLSLSTTGDLYLVGSDGVVLKYLYRNKNQQQRQQEGGSTVKEDDFMYIAVLYSEGYFILYKQRINGSISEESSSSIIIIALQSWPIYQKSTLVKRFFFFVGLCVLLRKVFSVAKAAARKRMNRSAAAKTE